MLKTNKILFVVTCMVGVTFAGLDSLGWWGCPASVPVMNEANPFNIADLNGLWYV